MDEFTTDALKAAKPGDFMRIYVKVPRTINEVLEQGELRKVDFDKREVVLWNTVYNRETVIKFDTIIRI